MRALRYRDMLFLNQILSLKAFEQPPSTVVKRKGLSQTPDLNQLGTFDCLYICFIFVFIICNRNDLYCFYEAPLYISL